MSSLSSAQIVSTGSSIHNKLPHAFVGPLALHASTPVSYPGAVSPNCPEKEFVVLPMKKNKLSFVFR